jgi:hypothetical protein
MPLRSDAYADLPPELATGVGNRLIELAAQAEEGQVVRIHIAVGGAVGQSQPHVLAELRDEVEEQ